MCTGHPHHPIHYTQAFPSSWSNQGKTPVTESDTALLTTSHPCAAYAKKKQELQDERSRREEERKTAKDAHRQRIADHVEKCHREKYSQFETRVEKDMAEVRQDGSQAGVQILGQERARPELRRVLARVG